MAVIWKMVFSSSSRYTAAPVPRRGFLLNDRFRQEAETARLLADAEERFAMQREADLLAAEDHFETLVKRYNVMTIASNWEDR